MAVEDYFYDKDWDGYQGSATCNRCGKAGLTWSDATGKWVLLNEMGEPHRCNTSALHRAVADDFEDE